MLVQRIFSKKLCKTQLQALERSVAAFCSINSWNPVFPAVRKVLIPRLQRRDPALFQGLAVVPTKRLAVSHEATGVQEHLFVPKVPTGNATKCDFIAM